MNASIYKRNQIPVPELSNINSRKTRVLYMFNMFYMFGIVETVGELVVRSITVFCFLGIVVDCCV